MITAQEAQELTPIGAYQEHINLCVSENASALDAHLDTLVRSQLKQEVYYGQTLFLVDGVFDHQIKAAACNEMIRGLELSVLGYRLMKGVYHAADSTLELVLNWETQEMLQAKYEAEKVLKAEAAEAEALRLKVAEASASDSADA